MLETIESSPVLSSLHIFLIASSLVKDGINHPAVQRLAKLGNSEKQPPNLARDLWRYAAKSIALLRCLKVPSRPETQLSFSRVLEQTSHFLGEELRLGLPLADFFFEPVRFLVKR